MRFSIRRLTCLALALAAPFGCAAPSDDAADPVDSATSNSELAASSPTVVINQLREIALFGTADLAATNALLAPRGLEAIAIAPNTALAAIVANDYVSSSIGPYHESYLTFVVKQISDPSPAHQGYVFLDLVTDKPFAAAFHRHFYNNRYELGAVNMTVPSATTAGSFGVLSAHEGLRVNVGVSPTSSWTAAPVSYDVYGFSSQTPELRYLVSSSGNGISRPYDATVDRYQVSPHSAMASKLAAVSFTPSTWSVASDFSGTISR